MSLKKQTLSGLVWTVTDTFILRGSAFLASIYLARILGPAEFGLIGMISIFVAIGTSLVDSGLSTSLIRTKEADDKDFSTVFYLNLGLSAIVYLSIYFLAPYVARFYRQEILIDIMRLYCLSFIITAFSAVQLARLNADMNFKKITILGIPGTILGIIVGIVLGNLGYGAWSIVMMYLSTQIVRSFSLWISSKWRPKLTFSTEKAKYHYSFGYKLMLSGLINTTFNYIYNILIGRFYSPQTLGHYERSRALNDYPSSVLTGVITRVTYPILAKIQDDKQRIAAVYKKMLRIMFFVVAPIMLLAAALAEPLFLLVLGKEWLPAVPLFQVLTLAFMFYPVHVLNLNIFKVFGRTDLFLKLELIKKVVIVINVLIAFQFGLMGLVWSSVFNSIFALLVNTYYSSEMLDYSTLDQLKDMFFTLVYALLMFTIVIFVIKLMDDFNLISQITIGAVVGIAFYLGINFVLKTYPLRYSLKLIKERKL